MKAIQSLLTKSAVGLAVSLGLLAVPLVAQVSTPEAKFRTQSSNVVVDVIIVDHKGRPVSGLTAEDFDLAEDGVAQKILSVIPPETPGAVRTNGTPAIASDSTLKSLNAVPGRPHLITVVLDLADNRPANIRRSCDSILKYFEKGLSPNDYVAIYYIDRSLHLALSFTNDLDQARKVLTTLEGRLAATQFGGGDRAAVQEQINDLYLKVHPGSLFGMATGSQAVSTGPGNTNPGLSDTMVFSHELDTLRSYLTTMNTFQAKTVFVALRAICLSYRTIPGRKSVVLFSEGFLHSLDAKSSMDAVVDAANRANVSFYVIDPVGLELGSALSRSSDTAASQMTQIATEGAGSKGGQSKFDRIRTVGEQSRNEQLEQLAHATGGLMVKNTNDLASAFNHVLEDARDYYTLAYEPTNKNYDGTFRKIKVESKGRGYQLRYRQGYWAIPQGQAVPMTPAAAQMISALRNGTLQPTVAPVVHAELLLAPDGQYGVPVSVSFPGTKVPFEKEGSASSATVVLVLLARDPDGKIVSVYQRDWRLTMEKKERLEFEKKTLVLQGKIPVPSLQSLKVDAIVQMGDAVAAGSTAIAIAEVSGSRPAVTSIMLAQHAEQGACETTSDPLCIHDVRLALPASNRFMASGRLILYFAASGLSLDPQSQKPRVGVTFALKSGEEVIKTVAAENVQALPGPTPDSVWVMAEYDLKTLRPGGYNLRATVQDIVRHSVQTQQAEFLIER